MSGSIISIEKTLGFLDEIKNAEFPEDLHGCLFRATAPFGVEHFIGGFIPEKRLKAPEQGKHVLLADWPKDWLETYFSKGMLYNDPTIRLVRAPEATFTWSSIRDRGDISSLEQVVMDQASEYGLADGLTVPLVSLEGQSVGFSFAGRHIDGSPDARGIVTLVASFAFGRAIELRNVLKRSKAKLTPREKEVARWIAAGKTDWEISIIFGVSAKAIAKHAYNLRLKLGAVNRAHAVAECFRLGLIE